MDWTPELHCSSSTTLAPEAWHIKAPTLPAFQKHLWILELDFGALFTQLVCLWGARWRHTRWISKSTLSGRSSTSSAAPAVSLLRCLPLNTLPLEARPLITITAACCHSVYWVSQWVILLWATLLSHTHYFTFLDQWKESMSLSFQLYIHSLLVTDI